MDEWKERKEGRKYIVYGLKKEKQKEQIIDGNK